MTYSSIAVFGIYRDRGHAEEAVDSLRAAGFRNSDVSVLLPDQVGAAASAASVGVVGGALGWLAGVGALAIPGVGPFIASGPILGGVGGENVVTGALIGMGIPRHEAARYEGRVLEGGVLLSVRCEDPGWAAAGLDVLRETSAKDVSFTGAPGAGSAGVAKMAGD